MESFAVLHASQLLTLAGPNRPRVGQEMPELGIISDGGMLVRDGKVEIAGSSREIVKGGLLLAQFDWPLSARMLFLIP